MNAMTRYLAAFLATVALPHAAPAALLRPATRLAASVVLLSDLFTDAGTQSALVLGPAPPPGEHIVVEAPQLDAIARQFGVDWRSRSGAERAVLDRPGVALAHDAVAFVLRAALDGQGAPSGDIVLAAFAGPLLPTEANAAIAVEQVAYDAGSTRFTAAILVTGTDMPPLRLRIGGEVAAMLDLPVAARPLPAGTVLQMADIRLAHMRVAGATRTDMALDTGQAVGLRLRRALPAGQAFPRADLARPAAVTRGDAVAMQLTQAGIEVTASGIALQDGALGERIDVANPASQAVLQAEITGPDTVQVAPGSLPRRAASPNGAGWLR